jgi:tetratricopeptide (TPR) repeat protein
VPLDTIVLRREGEPITGEITSPVDPRDLPVEVEIRLRSGVVTRFQRDDIRQVIPRRTAQQVYEAWHRHIRRLKDHGQRARAELCLGLWCQSPQPELDGGRAQPNAALRHFEKAVRLDPRLTVAYPHLVALFARANPIGQSRPEELNREVEVYLRALEAGYRSSEMDFRLGLLLSRQLGLPERAIPYLEAALEESSNAGQQREARSLLAQAYFAQGRPEAALGLYERLLAAGESAAGFEPLYEIARLRARMGGRENRAAAREHLVRARAMQPSFAEISLELAALGYADGDLKETERHLKEYLAQRPGDHSATVDLALAQIRSGRFAAAEKALRPLAESDSPLAARARLGLGSIEDNRGKPQAAAEEYRKAAQSAASGILEKLLLASALMRSGQLAEGRTLVGEVALKNTARRRVFAAASRLLAEAEISAGKDDLASVHFEYALDVDGGDPLLLERAGICFLRLEKPGRGWDFLRQVEQIDAERPAVLNGLGYYHYQQGELEEAARYFRRALKVMGSASSAGAGSAVALQKAYAQEALEAIKDLQALEVWVEEFEGPDPAAIEGWEKINLYGVQVERSGGQVAFSGMQENAADGLTGIRLMRALPARDLERLSASLRLDSGRASPVLALETREGRAGSAGLRLFRDLDGKVKIELKTSRGGWETPAPTSGEEQKSARMIYPGNVVWPDDQRFHTLEMRRTTAARSVEGFDLFFDGELVAQNVTVAGLRSSEYDVGVYARTDALGNAYSVTVENLKIYREARRAPEGRR